MDSPRTVDLFLSSLGQKHQKMKIDKKYLEVMGPIFTGTLNYCKWQSGGNKSSKSHTEFLQRQQEEHISKLSAKEEKIGETGF